MCNEARNGKPDNNFVYDKLLNGLFCEAVSLGLVSHIGVKLYEIPGARFFVFRHWRWGGATLYVPY